MSDAPRTVDIPDESVPEQLEHAAAQWPDRVAVDFLGAALTYAELRARVAKAAQGLLENGVGPGDRVALVMPNCTTHVVAFYAVLRIGAIVVEHNPTYTAEQLTHQLADSGATVAITWEKSAADVLGSAREGGVELVIAVNVAADLPLRSRLAMRLPVRKAREARAALRAEVPAGVADWDQIAWTEELPADHPYPAPEDVALIQYTGGTTGTPKGAVLSHRNLVANAAMCQAWTRVGGGTEIVYGALPFFHAFGMMLCLVYGVRTGASLVIFPKFDPAAMLAAQRRRPGTFLPAVPPMLDRFVAAARAKGVDLTSFSYAFSGAMPLPAATAQAWEDATGGLAIEGYGMTETAPVALGNPASQRRRPGSLGLPFPCTEIRVIDADSEHEVPVGERGELQIRGPQVFSGYWNQPEETAGQLSADGWLRTGDIVVQDEDGFVTLVDRIKEMIISGGFKVYPSQVEDHLRRMPGVVDVAVVGVPAEEVGEHVAAVFVLEGRDSLSVAEVREYVKPLVAGYAVPRRVAVVDELPRSIIGKVLRRKVREDLLAEG